MMGIPRCLVGTEVAKKDEAKIPLQVRYKESQVCARRGPVRFAGATTQSIVRRLPPTATPAHRADAHELPPSARRASNAGPEGATALSSRALW